jgi:hypothetical protein
LLIAFDRFIKFGVYVEKLGQLLKMINEIRDSVSLSKLEAKEKVQLKLVKLILDNFRLQLKAQKLGLITSQDTGNGFFDKVLTQAEINNYKEVDVLYKEIRKLIGEQKKTVIPASI